MRFEITTTTTFSASHQLRLYDGSLEPLHGHNWRVLVTVAADRLDAIGVVMDFHVLHHLLLQITDLMHNHHLNDVDPFSSGDATDNPSAENVAQHIGRSLRLPTGVQLVSSQVWETAENSAIYRP